MTYVIISRFARIVGKLSSTRTAEPRNKATKKTASTKIRKSMNLEGVDRQIESGTPRLRVAASLHKRKQRERHGRIILEGWRLIKEALMANAKPVAIFYTDYRLLDHISSFSLPKNCLAEVSTSTMENLSNTVTPPGIVGMFKRPRQGEGGTLKNDQEMPLIPLTVLCDGLKDPTNLGTLLRVCAASGCESFISSTSCADVWDPKVLRCAAGGHFHFPIYYRLSWEEIKKLLENKRVFLADNNTYEGHSIQPIEHYQVDWTLNPSVLVIGGEASGLGATIKKIAYENSGQMVHVPMARKIDSLSAAMAGTVLIYEAYRQVMCAAKRRE